MIIRNYLDQLWEVVGIPLSVGGERERDGYVWSDCDPIVLAVIKLRDHIALALIRLCYTPDSHWECINIFVELIQ